MTNLKRAKRALISGVLSMTLSCSMLVGTTFAWFTDEVESGVNTIVSGNLDVELEHKGAAENATFTTVQGATDLFLNNQGKPMLWEPNAETSETFKITNKGTLALKYTFSIAFANATATPEGKTLADVLTISVTDPATDTELQSGLLSDFTYSSSLTATATQEFDVTIAWPQSANDNAFNVKGGLKIDLGVKVVASQLTYEADGNGTDYDVNAPWTGAVDTAWYNDTATAFEIKSAEELAGLAELVNSGNKFENKTVTIVKDIDLNNVLWTPIGDVKNTFNGEIKGAEGVEIYNLYVSQHDYAALIGTTFTGSSIENIDIVNAYVESTHYAAAVLAHGYLTTTKAGVSGCDVYNATIKCRPELKDNGEYCNGDKAGVLVGWMACGDLTNNSATNSTVTAFRDLGGIAGHVRHEAGANVTIDVTGNKAEDVTLTYYKVTNMEGGDVNGNCAGIVGRYVSGSNYNVANNTEINVSAAESAIATVDSINTMKEVLTGAGLAGAGDTTIEFSGEDMDMTGEAWTPIKVDGYHGADIITIDGQGATITGLSAPLFAGGFAGGSGIIIKNLTIADSEIVSTNSQGSGAFVCTADSMDVITLENCHLINSTVTGSRTGGLIGWTAGYNNQNDGPVDTDVIIENCSVINCTIIGLGSVGAINGHAGNNPATFTTIKNCVIEGNELISIDDGGWRVGLVVGTANVGEVTISGITANNNTMKQYKDATMTTEVPAVTDGAYRTYYGRFVPGTTGTLVIEGTAI